MRRRAFLKALATTVPVSLVAPRAWAQKPSGARVLGVLSPHPAPTEEEWRRSPIVLKLAELGWVRGKDYVIDRPYIPGAESALAAMAQVLVRNRVDLIYANGPESAVAAARATNTIPIVFWGVGYPVEQGLVDSLARPGRNVTGMAFYPGFGSEKVIEVLREIAPWAKAVSVLLTLSAGYSVAGERLPVMGGNIAAAAKELGIAYHGLPVARSEDFERAFAATLEARADAIIAPGTTTTFRQRHRIAEFAIRHRLLSGFNMPDFVEAGGLFSYGANTIETVHEAVTYVDRIFRGAKPAELPVSMPSKLYLTVNMKTAMQIGLSFPQSILLRADRVVE
jgi:putative ABC transport system substrate-binding protein